MNQENNICQNIVGQANAIWNSIANFYGNYDSSGQINNTHSSNTSSLQTNQFTFLFIGLMIIFAVLHFSTPRIQNNELKTNSNPQQEE